MIAIGIRYLNGWSMAAAADGSDKASAEWPPHPDRLFMALAAAYFETDRDPGERDALLWLERQPPPELRASLGSEVSPRRIVTHYVPVNDVAVPRVGELAGAKQIAEGLRLLPQHRLRQPRQYPVAIPANDTVHFIWTEAEPTEAVRTSLASLCGKLTYLGHSASLVQGWLTSAPPPPTLRPTSPGGDHRLRVAGAGRLDELERAYNESERLAWTALEAAIADAKGASKKKLREEREARFGGVAPRSRRPRPARAQGYERVQPDAAPTAHSVFGDRLLMFAQVAGKRLWLDSTQSLMAAWRNTVMAYCAVQPPPEWVSGHRPDGAPSTQPHLAVVPIPNVGNAHAQGHLMGIALALPRGVPEAEIGRCLWRLFELDEEGIAKPLHIFHGKTFDFDVAFDLGERSQKAFDRNRWCGPRAARSRGRA